MPKNSSFELLVLYGLYTVTFVDPKKYAHCKEMAKTKLFDIPVTIEEKQDKTNYFKKRQSGEKSFRLIGQKKIFVTVVKALSYFLIYC